MPHQRTNPANIYLLKVSNKDTRKSCEICSKITIKTPERRLTPFSSVSSDFEQVNVSWEAYSRANYEYDKYIILVIFSNQNE